MGFPGNEAVACDRIRVGKEIGSAALVANGRHAHADALTSRTVLLGAVWEAGEIREGAAAVTGVLDVSEVRVRWVRHRMLHLLRYLSDATLHVDPAHASGIKNHRLSSHKHDGLPGHSH